MTTISSASSTSHLLVIAGALFVGALVHTLQYIRSLSDLKRLGICAATSLFGLLPGKRERHYRLEDHLFMVIGFFIFSMAFAFRKRIIGILNEQYLLHINIIYAFFLLTHLAWSGAESEILALALFPSIHTLVLILHPRPFKTGINVLSFVWFFLMNIVMLLGSIWHFLATMFVQGSSAITAWEALTMGPVLFLLIAYSLYIWTLVPLPGRHQTFRARIQEIKRFIRELDQAYDNAQLRRRQAALILVIEGGLLWLNYTYQLISPTIAINVSLILFSILFPQSPHRRTTIDL